jgi:carbon monoxide dehydrogenase subunit G
MAMTMNGAVSLAAKRDVVWHLLNDPETLKACIPGCESLEKISDTEFRAVVVNKVDGKRRGKHGRNFRHQRARRLPRREGGTRSPTLTSSRNKRNVGD